MALDLSATATKLLASLGSTTYVTAIDVSDTFDGTTGKATGSAETSTTLTAAVLGIKDVKIGNTLIKASDGNSKRIMFDKTYTPSMDTIFSFGGVRYKTISIDGFNHAGTQQYWDVICQK